MSRRPLHCCCLFVVVVSVARDARQSADEMCLPAPPLARDDFPQPFSVLQHDSFRASERHDHNVGGTALQELAELVQSRQDTLDKKKLAYVVVLFGLTPSVQEQVRVLRDSLVSVAKPSSKYATGMAAFVAAVTPQLMKHQDCLKDLGFDEIVQVPLLNPCPKRDIGSFGHVFTRLNVWNLTQYDKVLSLDSDMIVLQNIEELFRYNAPFAAPHDWPRGSLQGSCKCVSRICTGQVPGYPPSFDWTKDDHFLNSGLMLIEPNAQDFLNMSRFLTKWNIEKDRLYDEDSCQPSEQRFLGDYFFAGRGGDGFFPLANEIYNVRLVLVQGAPHMLTNPKVLHYIGSKPQEQTSVAADPIEAWFWRQWQDQRAKSPPPPKSCQAAEKEPAPVGAVEIADYLGQLSASDAQKRQDKCGPAFFNSGATRF